METLKQPFEDKKNIIKDFDVINFLSDLYDITNITKDDIQKLRKKIEEYENCFINKFDSLSEEDQKIFTNIDNLPDEKLKDLKEFIKEKPKFPGLHRLKNKIGYLFIWTGDFKYMIYENDGL